MITKFYYTADFYDTTYSNRWRDDGVEYDSLEELKRDTPIGKYRYRFIKRSVEGLYEIVGEQGSYDDHN